MFQVLDEKKHCVGIYQDGNIHYDLSDIALDKTWAYTSFLKDMDVEYASIYASGKSLDDCCPPNLQRNWKLLNDRLRAFITSFIEAKVSLKENCLFDLVPQRFLKEYCQLKNEICEYVFKTYEKPLEYNFFRDFTQLTSEIGNTPLNLDKGSLANYLYIPNAKVLWNKLNDGSVTNNIRYNMFDSVTGRLTTKKGSFPILNLSAKLRSIIKPNNHWFVCLDLNAAELRIALALAGQKQPEGDLHQECAKTLFRDELTRSQAKTVATEWLYNSQSELSRKYDPELSSYYNKKGLLDKYFYDGAIHTPYNRIIQCDEYHAISYLNQSTLIDMFHRQLLKISKFLENYKSKIAFMIHDSVVLDLEDSEKKILPDLIRLLSDTPYGNFPVKVEIGSDFGNTKKVNIKV